MIVKPTNSYAYDGDGAAGFWGGASITVKSGATLDFQKIFAVSRNVPITVDCGTLTFTQASYVHDLTLNSALVNGNQIIYTGINGTPVWKVKGEASTIYNTVEPLRSGSNTTFTVNFDSGASLDMKGIIRGLNIKGTDVFFNGIGENPGHLKLYATATNNIMSGLGAITINNMNVTLTGGGDIGYLPNGYFSDSTTVSLKDSSLTTDLWHTTNTTTFTLDHSSLIFDGNVTSYIDKIYLKNGSTIAGKTLGDSFNTGAIWNSTFYTENGTTENVMNYISADIKMVHTNSDCTITFNIADKAPLTVSGSFIPGGDGQYNAIVKNGAGTLTLSGANTYEGGVTVSAGVLQLIGNAIDNDKGIFTVNDGGTLEYNVASGEKTLEFTNAAYVLGNGDILKTGEGRLKINTDQLTGDLHFTTDNFVVTSGRVDLEGYMLGNIEVDANTVFSPGNSIGESTFGGGYILKDGATLLLEVGKEGDTILTDVLNVTGSTTFEDGAIIKIALDSSYDNAFEDGDQADIQLPLGILGGEGNALDMGNLVFQSSMFDLVGYDAGTGVLSVVYSAPAAGVPEPSTWVLLLLGAAGLLYVRKRK